MMNAKISQNHDNVHWIRKNMLIMMKINASMTPYHGGER